MKITLLREPTGQSAKYSGVLQVVEVLEGSKSEHHGPLLRTDQDEWVRLYIEGDNPFENPSLKPLVGQVLSVTGVWKNGTVVICPDDLVQLEQTPGAETAHASQEKEPAENPPNADEQSQEAPSDELSQGED